MRKKTIILCAIISLVLSQSTMIFANSMEFERNTFQINSSIPLAEYLDALSENQNINIVYNEDDVKNIEIKSGRDFNNYESFLNKKLSS